MLVELTHAHTVYKQKQKHSLELYKFAFLLFFSGGGGGGWLYNFSSDDDGMLVLFYKEIWKKVTGSETSSVPEALPSW